MYIPTSLEGLMKTTVGRQINKIQNTWYEVMSSEANGHTGRLHAFLSFLWEVQKYNDSKKLVMNVCRWRQDLLCMTYNLQQAHQNAIAGPKKNTSLLSSG